MNSGVRRQELICYKSTPNDADGDALQRVADHGSDMSQPMSIDFCVAIPDEISGKAVAEVATSSGYVAKVVKDHNGTQLDMLLHKRNGGQLQCHYCRTR